MKRISFLNNASFHTFSGLLILLTVFISCTQLDDGRHQAQPTGPVTGWLIPSHEVLDGGPGKDGIPSIDNPVFAPVSATTYVPDHRMVVGIRVGDEIRSYPHQVLDWHEIVNDTFGETKIAITFCPLTGTGIGWNRVHAGKEVQFGVSGLLFRNNLIAYDRFSDSHWSQMQLMSVQGHFGGQNIRTEQLIETSWATWKTLYPDSQVLTTQTGFQRSYQAFAYGQDYATNHLRIFFPVRLPDNRLAAKTRVLTVFSRPLDSTANTTRRAYPLELFGDDIRLINDSNGGRDYLLIGSTSLDISAAFFAGFTDMAGHEERPQFQAVQDLLPVVMEDDKGNQYDIFGFILSGPDAGSRLEPAIAYTGYWFAFADHFPEIEIFSF